MAEHVVDLLEPVEIDTQSRKGSACGRRAIQGLRKMRVEARPVREVGQRIVMREMLDLRFGRALFGDVLGHHQQILRLPVHAADRQSLAVGDAGAVARRFDRIAFERRAILFLQEFAIARDNGIRGRLLEDLMHGLADELFARHAEEFFRGAVDQNETKIGGILHHDGNRGVFDHRREELTRAARFFLGALALGHVDDRNQRSGAALIRQLAAENRNVDPAAVGLDVAGGAIALVDSGAFGDVLNAAMFVRRFQIQQTHAEKLFAAVTVMRDRGFVDGQELIGFVIPDPHRDRIGVEQQTEGFLPLLQFGDVDARADAAAVGGAALLDAHPAAAGELLFLVVAAPRDSAEPLGQPFFLAPDRIWKETAFRAGAQGLFEASPDDDLVARGVVHFGEAAIPVNVTALGIEKNEAFGNDVEGLGQPPMRLIDLLDHGGDGMFRAAPRGVHPLIGGNDQSAERVDVDLARRRLCFRDVALRIASASALASTASLQSPPRCGDAMRGSWPGLSEKLQLLNVF